MQASNRIIVNTLVQYVRSAVYMLLTLFSTRFVLEALGHSAYGVYAVVGSIVSMLSFLTQSLAVSTQRFLSFSHGRHDPMGLRAIFVNAFFLHTFVALCVMLVLCVLEPLCMGYLTIPPQLEDAGAFVYRTVILVVVFSFISAPVRALFIARENIVYVSVVEMLDAVFKLAGAIALPYIPLEGLRAYSLLILSVTVFNFIAYAVYARLHYDECRFFYWKAVALRRIRSLVGFAVWNVYVVGANVGRTQGLAIIMNHFLGTLVNTAYGIAQQVANAAGFIALSILNAVNPQLMKAEGAGDRRHMLQLSMVESRYSFLAMALVLAPVIVEMEAVLAFWLGSVPQHAVMLCRFTLAAYIMDQLTIGLSSANQAIGRIRDYSLLIGTLRLLTLPAAAWCLRQRLPLASVMWAYMGIEAFIGMIRLPYMKYTAGLAVWDYVRHVCLQTWLPVAGTVGVACALASCPAFPLRFLCTETLSLCTGMCLAYVFTLDSREKVLVGEKINRIKEKIL